MSFWRILTIFWLPTSIAVTALAIANVIAYFHPDFAWVPLFAQALHAYSGVTTQTFAPAGAMMHQYAGFGVPPWASDSIVAYTASASGIAFAGSSLTARDGALHALRSSAVSVGFPLAILGFAAIAVGRRVITRFAAQHTFLFVLYAAAVGGVLAAGVWGPSLLASIG